MIWDAVGAVAEAVGAAAVIATLVYLAIQIRHAAKASDLNAQTQLANACANLFSRTSQNDKLAEAVSGAFGGSDLTVTQLSMLRGWLGEYISVLRMQHALVEKGIIEDDDTLLSNAAFLDILKRAPVLKELTLSMVGNATTSWLFSEETGA